MVNIESINANLAMCGVSSILTLASTALTNSTDTFILNCIQFKYLSSSVKGKCNKCASGFSVSAD